MFDFIIIIIFPELMSCCWLDLCFLNKFSYSHNFIVVCDYYLINSFELKWIYFQKKYYK